MQAHHDQSKELDPGRKARGSRLTFSPSGAHEKNFRAQVLSHIHSGTPIPLGKSRDQGTSERQLQTGQQTRLHPPRFPVYNPHGGDSDTSSTQPTAHRSAFLAL